MLYRESVSNPFFGFPRCLKLMVKQNALLAVHLHYLGTGHQVGSPPTGYSVWENGSNWTWTFEFRLPQCSGWIWQRPISGIAPDLPTLADYFSVLFFWSQSINICELCLEFCLWFPGWSVWCVLGHVGVPLACNHVKLEDVPDMNYFSVNNEGEVGRLCPVGMSRQSWWDVCIRTAHNCEHAWVWFFWDLEQGIECLGNLSFWFPPNRD